jgi:hypothetical protein
MKKLPIIFLSFFVLAISACKKESSGDNVLEGSFVPAYVDFTTANLTIDPPTKDTAISLTFSVRTAYQQKVTATYSVTGAVTLTNQTAVIDRNTTSVAVNLPIPKGATGSVVVSLTKATLADGTVLRLGVQGAVDKPRTRTIKIGG